MSLRHILLGLLRKPASGYAIKQEFSASLRHFWHAELAQIYPTLHALQKAGLVTSRTEPSGQGPPRRVYRRTAAGARELENWLADGPTTGTERFPYLAQVMFLGDDAEPGARVEFFARLTDYFAKRVKALRAIDAAWRQDRDPDEFPDGELFPWMTLELGIDRNEVTLEWCRRCLERARSRESLPREGAHLTTTDA